jgi:hypothetical protein
MKYNWQLVRITLPVSEMVGNVYPLGLSTLPHDREYFNVFYDAFLMMRYGVKHEI